MSLDGHSSQIILDLRENDATMIARVKYRSKFFHVAENNQGSILCFMNESFDAYIDYIDLTESEFVFAMPVREFFNHTKK